MQESIDPKALITYIGSKIDGLSGPEPGFTIVGHKLRCFELISGTKALQYVTSQRIQEIIDPKALITYIGSIFDGPSGPGPRFYCTT